MYLTLASNSLGSSTRSNTAPFVISVGLLDYHSASVALQYSDASRRILHLSPNSKPYFKY